MPLQFEELDYQQTPLGEISLRRRSEPKLDGEVLYEVKLGDEFLMSSLFTEAEIQLAKIALSTLTASQINVVVGGLGLGYTAVTALEDKRVQSLLVIEVMEAVIGWHKKGLVPLGKALTSDSRCRLIQADFFELASSLDSGFYHENSERVAHAILVDIDHSPSHWLNQSNSSFYTQTALRQLKQKLHPGGVFGLWSNEPEDSQFMHLLDTVFDSTQSHHVSFANPYTQNESSNTVYIAHKY